MQLNDAVRREQRPWSGKDSLRYYQTSRREVKDLYETERYFLPDILQRVESVLDVGCAAGGFSNIMLSFNPAVRYVGVDVNPEFIDIARKDFPRLEFHISDGIQYPFPPESFDLVHCSGMLHLNSCYPEITRGMWRQTRRYMLCDFRLAFGETEKGKCTLRFGETDSGEAFPLPYYIVNISQILNLLLSLRPRPSHILAKGYSHPVSSFSNFESKTAIMTFFLLEKSPSDNVHLDLSFDI